MNKTTVKIEEKGLYDIHHEKPGPEYGTPEIILESCYTKKDKIYIGDEDTVNRYIIDYGIVHFRKASPDHTVASIGFNPLTNTWYGWSHRAIYGFKVGSKIEKGCCGYIESSVDEMMKNHMEWHGFDFDPDSDKKIPKDPPYDPETNKYTRAKIEDGKFYVGYSYQETDGCNPDGSLKMKEEIKWRWDHIPTGKGEWTAETLDDAEQMAKDFAEGVS